MSLYRIARAAQGDLDEIWCYIGSFDLRAADQWLDSLESRFKLLATQPQVGQARPDIAPGLRLLPVRNYLIFHRLTDDGVEIVRIIHGSRNYGRDLFDTSLSQRTQS